MQVYSYVFTRDRLGRRGMGITPNVKEWLDCEELPLRNSHKQVKSLWVKIKDYTNKGLLELICVENQCKELFFPPLSPLYLSFFLSFSFSPFFSPSISLLFHPTLYFKSTYADRGRDKQKIVLRI